MVSIKHSLYTKCIVDLWWLNIDKIKVTVTFKTYFLDKKQRPDYFAILFLSCKEIVCSSGN